MASSRRFTLTDARTPWQLLWHQPFSMLMRMPWPLFLASMVGLFLVQVAFFWLLFHFDAAGIGGEESMGLPKSMVYSLQTMLGASFGSFMPESAYTLAVSAVESLAGILTIAVVTSLFLARLLQTEAPLIFSRTLCLSGLPDGHLFCRFATIDPSSWLDVSYGLSLFLDVEIEPKVWQRKIVPLELLNAGTPQLSLTATITHPIDERSPFRRHSLDELRRANALFVYLVQGTDEITGTPLLQVHTYRCDDIALDRRFEDLVEIDASGARRVRIERLDQVRPMGE
jgi:hypothetical protein